MVAVWLQCSPCPCYPLYEAFWWWRMSSVELKQNRDLVPRVSQRLFFLFLNIHWFVRWSLRPKPPTKIQIAALLTQGPSNSWGNFNERFWCFALSLRSIGMGCWNLRKLKPGDVLLEVAGKPCLNFVPLCRKRMEVDSDEETEVWRCLMSSLETWIIMMTIMMKVLFSV